MALINQRNNRLFTFQSTSETPDAQYFRREMERALKYVDERFDGISETEAESSGIVPTELGGFGMDMSNIPQYGVPYAPNPGRFGWFESSSFGINLMSQKTLAGWQAVLGISALSLSPGTLAGRNNSTGGPPEQIALGSGLVMDGSTLKVNPTIESLLALSDPDADRMLFWDDSAGSYAFLAPGNSVAIAGTTLDTIQDIRTTATPQFARIGLGTPATSINPIEHTTSVNNVCRADFENTNSGTVSRIGVIMRADTAQFVFDTFSSTNTSNINGVPAANAADIFTVNASILSIRTDNAAPIIFGINSAEVARLTTVGLSVQKNVQINDAAGTFRNFRFMSSDVERWRFSADNTAESGGNAGSDFNIYRYSDAGGFLGTMMYAIRSTGKVQFPAGIEGTSIGDATPSTGVFTYGKFVSPFAVAPSALFADYNTIGRLIATGPDPATQGNFSIFSLSSDGSIVTQTAGFTPANVIFSGSITTAAPSGGTAQPWKFGNRTVGIALQGGTVRVEIDGVAVDLLTT